MYTEFYTEAALKRWEWYKKRGFAIDRCADQENFREYNLDKFLERLGLLRASTYARPFVADIVKQFYANLIQSYSNTTSKKYGKTYVRGGIYTISPWTINRFLGRENYVDTMVRSNVATIARILTKDKDHEWRASGATQHQDYRAVYLTSLFDAVHKLMTSNWLPTSNNSNVSSQQMELLYKIGREIPFDLGKLIFEEIVKQRRNQKLISLSLP